MESKEREFLRVKQKLDELRLPTIFPIECTDLISKLLTYATSQLHKTGSYECLNKKQKSPLNHRSIDLDMKVKVLGTQLQKTVNENNTLHFQNIHLKQDNQILRKRILLLQGIKINPGEHHEVEKMRKTNQKQLKTQLAKVTKKHNQLLNKVYGEEDGFDKLDKKYINKNHEQQFNQALPPRKNMMIKQDKKHVQIQNNSHQANKMYNKNNELLQTIESLKNKVKVREDEIARLQQKMSYDGLNINKLIKDFQEKQAFNRNETLNHQIDLLNKQNFKLKDELKKVKTASGRAEVLRVQNEKLKEKLDKEKKVASDNKNIIDNNQQKNKITISNLRNQIGSKQLEIQDVQKIIQKLQNQNRQLAITIKSLQKQLNDQVSNSEALAGKIQSLEEQITTLKNIQEGEKIFLNYEMEDFKKKHYENQSSGKQSVGKIKDLTNKIQQIQQVCRVLQQEVQMKNESIENLQEIVKQQQRVIDDYETNEQKLQSPLQQQLNYTSNHLNEVAESKKQLQLQINHLKIQNDHFKKRLQQSRSRHQGVLEQQHIKITSEVSKLLRINQQLRNQLEKSNTNVQSVQQSIIQLQRTRQQLRKQAHLLSSANGKISLLEAQYQQLSKNLLSSEDKIFKTREQNKKLRIQFSLQNQKFGLLEQQHALLLEFKRVNVPRLTKMQQEIFTLGNSLKQEHITNTLISQQNNSLKKQLIKLQGTLRQFRFSSFEPKDEAILRGQLNSLVGKHQTLIMVNKNLKQSLLHLKNQNDQMMLDRGNFMKEANHLRLQIHELEQRNIHYKQSQESLRQLIRQLQNKGDKKDRSASKHLDPQISTQQLRSKIEQIQQSYRQAMLDSGEVVMRS